MFYNVYVFSQRVWIIKLHDKKRVRDDWIMALKNFITCPSLTRCLSVWKEEESCLRMFLSTLGANFSKSWISLFISGFSMINTSNNPLFINKKNGKIKSIWNVSKSVITLVLPKHCDLEMEILLYLLVFFNNLMSHYL